MHRSTRSLITHVSLPCIDASDYSEDSRSVEVTVKFQTSPALVEKPELKPLEMGVQGSLKSDWVTEWPAVLKTN